MDDLDALLADLESSTAHISPGPAYICTDSAYITKSPVHVPKSPSSFLIEETPYSFPTSGRSLRDEATPPPVPPPPSAEALNGTLLCPPDSQHSSQQSLGSGPKSSSWSRGSTSPQLSSLCNTEEDHIYSFPNKQKACVSGGGMATALGSNLSELDRLLLELNAVQNTPGFPTDGVCVCVCSPEEEAPAVPVCTLYPVGEGQGRSSLSPQHNGSKGSSLDHLHYAVPSPLEFTDGQLDPDLQQSATSATRELDELMACLSDFKPSSQGSSEPPPPPSVLKPSCPPAIPSSPAAAPVFSSSSASSSSSLPPLLSCDSPLPNMAAAPPAGGGGGGDASLELHIEEDGSDRSSSLLHASQAPSTSLLKPSSMLSLSATSTTSTSSTTASSSLSPPSSGSPSTSPSSSRLSPDTIIDVSASMLSSRTDPLVVITQPAGSGSSLTLNRTLTPGSASPHTPPSKTNTPPPVSSSSHLKQEPLLLSSLPALSLSPPLSSSSTSLKKEASPPSPASSITHTPSPNPLSSSSTSLKKPSPPPSERRSPVILSAVNGFSTDSSHHPFSSSSSSSSFPSPKKTLSPSTFRSPISSSTSSSTPPQVSAAPAVPESPFQLPSLSAPPVHSSYSLPSAPKSSSLPEATPPQSQPQPQPAAPSLGYTDPEPSLDEALDKLLAMSFSTPPPQHQQEKAVNAGLFSATRAPLGVSELPLGARQEVLEEPIQALDRRDVRPDTMQSWATGPPDDGDTTDGDGTLDYQSDGRSELDWAEMDLKMAYEGEGGEGTMTPMTEASWMDESLTPYSSCPGTPDTQMLDLGVMGMVTPLSVDRVSASGHLKQVIRRTKETTNVHPMYRDMHPGGPGGPGGPRRKMGPLLFHKSSSQDRLIEELQGRLGISRKERAKKQPDDWLTEGVIVSNNPKRDRDRNGHEVDKIIIPPESPIPQRKVIPAPISPPVVRREEPKRPPPVKEVPPPLPPPPPRVPSPPPPPPPQQRAPTPPPEKPPVKKEEPPSTPRAPAPAPVPQPPPVVAPTPPSPPAPKEVVSVGCQTEYDPLFPPMQAWGSIMSQGKGSNLQQGNKLDSMLGSLQSDLNKLGVHTVAKGTCGACCKPIIGQLVTAMGRTWHPEHFVCTHCQEEIGSRNFFERDGLPYCERDYHHLFSPRCHYCNGPILDKVVTAMDQTWHPEHFFCGHCGSFFGPEGFHEKDGKAYCRKDYFELFAPKCGGCAHAILDNYISALSCLWHPECFVCRECFTPFVQGSFFEHEGQPFCEVHYHDRRGSLCSGCQKPITGRCISAMAKKFHPEHFVCAFCLKQLNKGTFKEQNDKPYCQGCFIKLFS
ncbi:mucin-5AC-like [Engraulis encrasicolus]|uniref:mucin-5AC-like n=1 Tax=Engraulis encrasicolus TaxID=184585 RepID=UPI002FCEC0F1